MGLVDVVERRAFNFEGPTGELVGGRPGRGRGVEGRITFLHGEVGEGLRVAASVMVVITNDTSVFFPFWGT